jgi:hypothetical protein
MKKTNTQWELSLTVQEKAGGGKMASVERAGEVAALRWTATGLDLPETTTLEQVHGILQTFKAAETHMAVALADIFSFARKNGWEKDVEVALGELEFDVALVRKALAVGDVPRGLRHPDLTGEHYFVVSRLLYDDQVKWLQRAVKHKMAPLVLKRSIEAGKVLTKEQIEMMSGAGSGILNYHGILTNWQRWEKKVGGEDAILGWPRDVLQRWYEDVKPLGELIDKAEEKLNSDAV